MFDFLALYVSLLAVGCRVDPVLVLLAFVAGSALAMIPITPGGLGFVEAGLTGVLTLAGVTPEHAVLATLLYRLFSYWLPLPAGLVASILFRRRHRMTTAGLDAGEPRRDAHGVVVGAVVATIVVETGGRRSAVDGGVEVVGGSVVAGHVDGGGGDVVVGTAAAAGHVNVASASSPQAKRLTTFQAPSTSTTVLTSGYGVSR